MRLELTKKTDLALRALGELHRDGDVAGVRLAEAIGTTTNFLPQVLKPLVATGWISSTPGPGGGYGLNGDLSHLSVRDVIEVSEGGLEQKRCVLRDAPCPAPEPCALHDSWTRAWGALLAELGSMPLATAFGPAPTKGE